MTDKSGSWVKIVLNIKKKKDYKPDSPVVQHSSHKI